MDRLLYIVARALIACLQALPLPFVARLGAAAGVAGYWLDARHRRAATRNLAMCFAQERSPAEIRALAKENFRRIGENFACAVKTAVMTPDELRPYISLDGFERLLQHETDGRIRSRVVAIGHFGNFELYARSCQFVPAFQCVTTYRGLRQPLLNELLQSMRALSGCLYFERRTEGAALKAAMANDGMLLGLLADQHGGDRGIRLPFLGHDCSTSPAPVIFALRYDCPLHVAICYRVGLARWRLEVSAQIPTQDHGRPRPVETILRDVNRAFEDAVRRDPSNWFWVHNRWKPGKWKSDRAEPVADEQASPAP